jgi:hypothetical protein
MQIMPILFTLRYNGSLVTWTIVSLTATKFKHSAFSVSGFALPYAANIVIVMIFYDFWSESELLYDSKLYSL